MVAHLTSDGRPYQLAQRCWITPENACCAQGRSHRRRSAYLVGPSRREGSHGEAPGRAGRRAREGRSARPDTSGTRALAGRARGAGRGGVCSSHQPTRRPSALLAALPSVVSFRARRSARGDTHARRGRLRRPAVARCEPGMSASRDLCGAPSRVRRAPLPASLASWSAHEMGLGRTPAIPGARKRNLPRHDRRARSGQPDARAWRVQEWLHTELFECAQTDMQVCTGQAARTN